MPDASLIGLTLAGRFRLTGVIGQGGMATVYRGVEEGKPGSVAIKLMNAELASDSRFVRRFRREAKAASMLKHPNSVSILEFGVDKGHVFLVMECLEGSDLALLLHREKRVPERRAVQIVVQVCAALAAAHELSIVHRDLKPDNIMLVKPPEDRKPDALGLAPTDYVKVLDFGIAKILDEDAPVGTAIVPDSVDPDTAAKSLLTRVGTIVGTPAYMSPEQGRAEPVDGRTDVYACGVLLYELITGRVPFTGETPMQVVMRHVNEPPMPPSKIVPIDSDLEAIIMKALAKWPNERHRRALDLANALRNVLPRLSAQKRGRLEAASSGPRAPTRVGLGESEVAAGVEKKRAAISTPAPKLVLEPEEAETLVIDDKPKPGEEVPAKAQAAPAPRAAQPAAQPQPKRVKSVPSFPTLNLELPDDLGVDSKQLEAKSEPAPRPAGAGPAPAPAGGVSLAGPAPARPAASPRPEAKPDPRAEPAHSSEPQTTKAPPPTLPSDDDDVDDVRTLAREIPVVTPREAKVVVTSPSSARSTDKIASADPKNHKDHPLASTLASAPEKASDADAAADSEDEPKTMVATGRASLPDIATSAPPLPNLSIPRGEGNKPTTLPSADNTLGARQSSPSLSPAEKAGLGGTMRQSGEVPAPRSSNPVKSTQPMTPSPTSSPGVAPVSAGMSPAAGAPGGGSSSGAPLSHKATVKVDNAALLASAEPPSGLAPDTSRSSFSEINLGAASKLPSPVPAAAPSPSPRPSPMPASRPSPMPASRPSPSPLAASPAPSPRASLAETARLPERRPRSRLSGPLAMGLGIVIGALLFGVLATVFLLVSR